MSERLRVDRSGPRGLVARVTMTRPEVRNAFDASLIAELRSTFAGLARESPGALRAIVLGGEGAAFCAGADVTWMRASLALDREANEQDAMAMAEMFDAIDTCPVPVIARVQGAAIGGGMGLCAVSDLVIAESGTRFGFTETRLGILPAVIAPFVVAKIGESHARALFPSGRRFDAVRAQRIGLVHEVVEGEAALDAAVESALRELLAAGPTAARAAKAVIREVRGLPHGASKWHTARVIATQRRTDEAQEGFRAFLERRRPAWDPEAAGDVGAASADDLGGAPVSGGAPDSEVTRPSRGAGGSEGTGRFGEGRPGESHQREDPHGEGHGGEGHGATGPDNEGS